MSYLFIRLKDYCWLGKMKKNPHYYNYNLGFLLVKEVILI